VASGELGGSLLLSVLALAAPVVALALGVLCAWLVVRTVRKLLGRSAARATPS
jgi:hypothetical protein